VVRDLIASDASVAILDRARSDGDALARALGPQARFFATDVTDDDQIEAAVRGTVAAFGRVDLNVNCAGVAAAGRIVDGRRTSFSLEKMRRLIDVNLIGSWAVARACALRMTENHPAEDDERGLIILTGSIAGIEGQAGQTAYSASKAGVIGMTLPMARDLAPWGIRVMTICPGPMETPMIASVDQARRQEIEAMAKFPRRVGRVEDFVKLVRSVMENTMLNGEIIRLDGAARQV
jgi:3-hydroxyacyl-CoA dehydrogenase/3-hydroxy-2-methylbutyryl-CoA dehydrogenase